jgi:GNAT superfamily N-acetyltransferase
MSPKLAGPTLKYVAPNVLEVTVTYLEMTTRPAASSPPTPPVPYRIERVDNPSVPFYRFLYNTVGAPWLWHERRRTDDTTLASILADERLWLHVIYAEGEPAGYAELDERRTHEVQLAYFGIVPKYIGHRLGPALLRHATDDAWTRNPRRVWVHTCSLDHPKALPCYQQAGFTIYDKVVRRIRDPRPLPLNL